MQTNVTSKKRSLTLPPSVSGSQTSGEIEAQSSVVVVGANGSGKTRLGSWIDLNSPQKSLVHRVGAQKSLLIPDFCSTSSIDIAESNLLYGLHQPNVPLEQLEQYKIGQRWQSKPNTHLLSDFDKLLTYLFTEEFDKSTKYRQQAINAKGISEKPPETRLDIIKRIWEFVLPHRELTIGAGKIEATSRQGGGSPYHASEMSDGERVIFYLIGQCLAAKENGIVVIDEPEIHIHKALQSRLWDAVEAERADCLFVYLTHDLDFAVTRLGATKVWLKSYENNQWDWHLVESEDVPERLLLEILGSRKPILFVEGDQSSLDYFLFSRFFKNFTVTPCGGHEQVVHSTISFSKLKNLHNLECKGIIDRDFRTDEQVEYLRQRGIFCLNTSEIENLLLSEDVLRAVATAFKKIEEADSIIEQTQKLVFTHMGKEKQRLVSAIVAARIEANFSKFNAKASGKEELVKALNDVTSGIDIESLYAEITDLVDNTLLSQNYSDALRLYNNKGLLPQVSSLFGFKTNKDNNELVNYIKRLFNDKDNRMILEAFQKATPELVSLGFIIEVPATENSA